MEDPVKVASDSFSANRKEAEKILAAQEREVRNIEKALANSANVPWWKIGIHFHRKQAKKALARKRVEINFIQKNVEKYLKAEDGLKSGNYEPAISVLEEISDNLSRQPTVLGGTLFGPDAVARQMARLKDELVLLQKQG